MSSGFISRRSETAALAGSTVEAGRFSCGEWLMLGSGAYSGKRLHDVQHTPVSGKGKSASGGLRCIGVSFSTWNATFMRGCTVGAYFVVTPNDRRPWSL